MRKKIVADVPPTSPGQIRVEYLPIGGIHKYDRNPRDNSKAVSAVRKSLREFGFLVPIVVDSNYVIAAGHTRYEAAMQEGLTVVPVIRASHLSERQIQAFRVADNKLSELADWRNDYLALEMQEIIASGITMEELGFTEQEIDCLSDMVADDCLSAGEFQEDRSTVPEEDRASTSTRAPSNTRCVIGPFVFSVPASAFNQWAADIRTSNEYNGESIITDLKTRLGLSNFING